MPKNSQKDSKKPEMSIESYHKLNRAKNVSFHIHLHVRAHGLDYQPMPFLPDIFSYLSEDVSYVLEEVKDLGLVDHFENKSAEENVNDHRKLIHFLAKYDQSKLIHPILFMVFMP